MAKKMYDILPPAMASKVEDTIKSLGGGSGRKRSVKKTAKTAKRKRFFMKEILIGAAVILVLIGIYFYYSLAQVFVVIQPQLHSFSLEKAITADASLTAVDALKNAVPGRYIQVKKDATAQFPATGSASNDGKASGTIKVYNKISPATSFVLKAGTHFLSDSGKYFVTLQKVTIPAAQKSTPGAIEVKVQAEQSGGEYNIGASKFSVPKLSGTSYYYGIWAESTSAMSGGYAGSVKKVTSDDIAAAKDSLTKKLFDQAQSDLQSQVGSDEVLLDGAITKTVVSAASLVKADTVMDSFNEQVAVAMNALVFKRADAAGFVAAQINQQLVDDNNLLEKSVVVDYNVVSADTTGKKINLTLKASYKTYASIGLDDLRELFMGKNSDQIKAIVNSRYGGEVASLQVHFWPFWVTKAPSNKDKITVTLDFSL